jgi:hypothetical protein
MLTQPEAQREFRGLGAFETSKHQVSELQFITIGRIEGGDLQK